MLQNSALTVDNGLIFRYQALVTGHASPQLSGDIDAQVLNIHYFIVNFDQFGGNQKACNLVFNGLSRVHKMPLEVFQSQALAHGQIVPID